MSLAATPLPESSNAPELLAGSGADRARTIDKAELYAVLGREAHAIGLDLHYWRDRVAFPRRIGFDLDTLLPRSSWSRMFHFLQGNLPKLGWEVLTCVRRGHLWTCFLARRDADPGHDGDFLELEFHSDFTVGGVPFANTHALLCRAQVSHGVCWLDDVDAAVVSYLEPAIAHGRVKARYAEALAQARTKAPGEVRLLVEDAVGVAAAAAVLDAPFSPSSWRSVRLGALWAALTRRPFQTGRIILHKLMDAVAMYRTPPGRFWTLSGPDGVGKTTVLRWLHPLVERRMAVALDRLHTRPYLIPRLALLLPRRRREQTLQIRQREQKIGLVKSIIRLAILIIDYQLGYWIMVRPKLARGHLVLFDRYYQDFLVDPTIRGIALPPAWLRACAHLVPHANRHVYLTASCETLRARKSELSYYEAKQQTDHYRRLALADSQAILVTTEGRPVKEVAKELASILLDDIRKAARSTLHPQ